MARKHLLDSVTASLSATDTASSPSEARSEYAKRGASRSMMLSLDEMAENSMRILEGETVVSIDPTLLEGSFIADRVGDDDDDYRLLLEAIRQAGQSSPILVRPHPDDTGRYMIVYGHRRARVARELGINVRAIIKPLEDIAHIIAQGQENTARANLTFIEKSLFAKKLSNSGMTKDTIRAALTVDDTLLSRMLAVVENVPVTVLEAVGSAKGVGRDRWEELKKLVILPLKAKEAIEFVGGDEFTNSTPENRFDVLLSHLNKGKKPKQLASKAAARTWALADNTVSVSTKGSGKTFTLALKSKDASRFGTYVSEQLEQLYREFRQRENEQTGD